MTVSKELALKVWTDAFGNVEWVADCFGTWMNKNAYSNEAVLMRMPNDDRNYDYSWNIDHIRPISDFSSESDADFMNNYEPMHRQNNVEKSDNYPDFKIGILSFQVVRTSGFHGYGIVDQHFNRIDWKAKKNKHY